MNVLVLGSGGREHALTWSLSRSSRIKNLYLHPGNAGTRMAGYRSFDETPLEDFEKLVAQARLAKIDLVVIGPENLLAKGYADGFRREGFLVFGPNREAAQLESSKYFAKEFMKRAAIPTAGYSVADSEESLRANLVGRTKWPVALKLDGLAAGKGVLIAPNLEEGLTFGKKVWVEKTFGEGNHQLVIEDYLEGREISYIGFCDGKLFLPLASATDYKRLNEGDTGPNTGGMGVVSPSPYLHDKLENKIREQIIQPLLRQLQKEKLAYCGALYVGLMVDKNENPFVIEFNARFGDPETQATLLRLDSDLLDYLENTAKQSLSMAKALQWKKEVALYLVLAASGYPDKPRTGDRITKIPKIKSPDALFFSGVKAGKEGELLTAGGRVLGVGVVDAHLEECRKRAYAFANEIQWEGKYFRKDIGVLK